MWNKKERYTEALGYLFNHAHNCNNCDRVNICCDDCEKDNTMECDIAHGRLENLIEEHFDLEKKYKSLVLANELEKKAKMMITNDMRFNVIIKALCECKDEMLQDSAVNCLSVIKQELDNSSLKFEEKAMPMKKELNQKDCEACLNQFIEDTNYYLGDTELNDHDEEIETLRQLIKEHFELKEKYSKILDDVHDYRYETHAMKMTIRNLCEHFGVKNEEALKNIYLNPPLKFEELKEGMWVWDNKYDMFNQILELRITCWEEQEIEFNYSLETDDEIYNDIFEENRFYRKEVKDD